MTIYGNVVFNTAQTLLRINIIEPEECLPQIVFDVNSNSRVLYGFLDVQIQFDNEVIIGDDFRFRYIVLI